MVRKIISLFVVFTALCYGLPVRAGTITAESWVIADNNGIISSKNSDQVRSIASITKLITVMVFLDAKPYPNNTERELILRTIVSSDNKAAKTLCEGYPGGYDDCIFMMNTKVKEMGLQNTRFLEPTGLSVFNVSTAEELLKIVEEASKYPLIVESSNTKSFKVKKHVYNNTFPYVDKHDTIVSKTGYIRMSGGCIVVMIRTESGTKTAVLLGSKNTKTRIKEVETLLN